MSRTAQRRRLLLSGLAAFIIGLLVLVSGLLPPGVIGTGQLSPFAWALPSLIGLAALLAAFHWLLGPLSLPMGLVAAAVVTAPPLALCLAGAERVSSGFMRPPVRLALADARPRVAVLSGPSLFAPVQAEEQSGMIRGFAASPLWQALSRSFDLNPVDALDEAALRGNAALLVVQPRPLAPAELVALDRWVRGGGRAVLLVDPDLRWTDGRPLGDPLRPPPASLLGPLLRHWGLSLDDAPPVPPGAKPVERRFLGDGRLLQLAGASRFRSASPQCRLSQRGLVAHCRLGRGEVIAVADADFANDALWTTAPERPDRSRYWTSDAVPVIADWLATGAGASTSGRVWLQRTDGLPGSFRVALVTLLGLSALPVLYMLGTRTKNELEASSHP